MASGDDDGLRRAWLPEQPRAQVHTAGCDQLDLLVIGLELERSEREVVEEGRPCGTNRPPVQRVGHCDVQDQQACSDESHEGLWTHHLSLSLTARGGFRRQRGAPCQLLFVAAEHKEKQAEPVQPPAYLFFFEPVFLPLDRNAPPFGPPPDAPTEFHPSQPRPVT